MDIIQKHIELVVKKGGDESKQTVFLIGNTTKEDSSDYYITPIRNYNQFVVGGVIVYKESVARNIAKMLDGTVDYIFADAEKKIHDNSLLPGELANIERVVKEEVNESIFISYKGNDLTVDAADAFISEHYLDNISGVGGKNVAIIGSGNIGSKLAMKLVERGANVFLYRRNSRSLNLIVDYINITKSLYTVAKANVAKSIEEACDCADIVIGATSGGVISEYIVNNLAQKTLLIDVGKGSISDNGIVAANVKDIEIYRLSVESMLEGLISSLISVHSIYRNKTGRRKFGDITVVSGGILARDGEIVVDDYNAPRVIHGIGNGAGDFYRGLGKSETYKLDKLRKIIG